MSTREETEAEARLRDVWLLLNQVDRDVREKKKVNFIELLAEVADITANGLGRPSLTFDYLRSVNAARSDEWHADGEPWTGADWSNATLGELGEAANIVKKLRRAETGVPGSRDPKPFELREKLAEEIADTLLYLDLLAYYYDIDLGAAVVAKFDAVSVREGFPHRLGPKEEEEEGS